MFSRSWIWAMGAIRSAPVDATLKAPAPIFRITQAEAKKHATYMCSTMAKSIAYAASPGGAKSDEPNADQCKSADHKLGGRDPSGGLTFQDCDFDGTNKICVSKSATWDNTAFGALLKGGITDHYLGVAVPNAVAADTVQLTCQVKTALPDTRDDNQTKCERNPMKKGFQLAVTGEGTWSATNHVGAKCMFAGNTKTDVCTTQAMDYIPNACMWDSANSKCIVRVMVSADNPQESDCTFPHFKDCLKGADGTNGTGADGSPGPAGAPGKAASSSSRSFSVLLAGVSMVAAIMV